MQNKDYEIKNLQAELKRMDELLREGRDLRKQSQKEREQCIRLNTQSKQEDKTIQCQLAEINRLQEKCD